MVVDGDRLLVVETAIGQVIVGLDDSDRVPDGFVPFGNMAGIDVTDRWIDVSDDGANQLYRFHKRN